MILFIFVTLGAILPFVNDEFSTGISEVNTGELTEGVTHSSVGILTIALSILKMMSWSFGDLPFFLETIIFLPLRIIFYFLIYRQIRGIGG